MNEDTTVVIRHADGNVTIRSEEVSDITIFRFTDASILLGQDEDRVFLPAEVVNEVLSVLDLLSTEGSPEEDIEDYLEAERTVAYVDGFRDGYDEGTLESEQDLLDAFDAGFEDGLHYEDEDFESMDEEPFYIPDMFVDGEMDEYLV